MFSVQKSYILNEYVKYELDMFSKFQCLNKIQNDESSGNEAFPNRFLNTPPEHYVYEYIFPRTIMFHISLFYLCQSCHTTPASKFQFLDQNETI